jgi:Ca2+-binding EF-hand superfamily protein
MVSPIINRSDSYSVQHARSLAAQQMFQSADSNSDGKITEDELTRSMAARGNNEGPGAAELFKQLDQGSKGYLTQRDVEAGLEKLGQSQPAQDVPRSGPPEGGGGASAAATTFDAEDLNQDGRVTMQEKVQYALKIYLAQKEAESVHGASVYA